MIRSVKIALLFLWIVPLSLDKAPAQAKSDSLILKLRATEIGSPEYLKYLLLIAKEVAESRPDSAVDLTTEAISALKTKSDDKLLAQAYIVRSISLSYKAQYDSSISYSFAALELAEKMRDTTLTLDAYNNLGIDFMYQEEFSTSEDYYKKLKDHSRDFGDTLRWAHALNNLGMLYGLMERFREEVEHYSRAATLFKKIGEMEGFANTLINTGTTHTAVGNYSEATKYYEDALSIYEDLGYVSAIVHARMSLSENSFLAGNSAGALSMAFSALKLIKENDFEQDEIYLYELLERIYEKQGKFKLAYEYQKKGFELKEKVFNAEKSLQINKLEAKYQTSVKEAEIDNLKLENQLNETQLSQTRWQMAFISAGAVSLVALAIFLYWLKLKKVKAEQIEQQLRFEALQKRYMELLNGPSKVDFDIDLEDFNKKLFNPLTSREYDVLKLSMSGKTNQEIADEIFVSLSTIKFHMGNIYNKLGVNNKKEALEYVVKSS